MIPHSRPTLGNQEVAGVTEVLRSGQLASGPKVEEFERRFARTIEMPDAVAVNSGTSGLHLALLALDVGKGDEVIMPSYVCSAVLNAVAYVGAIPVLADSLPDHGHMDPAQARVKISKKTKAIILVHLFGDMADARPWRRMGVPIIEDGTQSLGNKNREGAVGSLGDLSVFSFYATKIITTGEGGMIGVREPRLAASLRDVREYDEKESCRTRYNYKMTDLSAAMGMAQLDALPSFLQGRKNIAERYDKALTQQGVERSNQDDSIFYRYVLRCSQSPAECRENLRGKDIQCKQPVYSPLHRVLGLLDKQFPHAALHHQQNLSIPLYPSLKEQEIKAVCNALSELRRVEVL